MMIGMILFMFKKNNKYIINYVYNATSKNIDDILISVTYRDNRYHHFWIIEGPNPYYFKYFKNIKEHRLDKLKKIIENEK